MTTSPLTRLEPNRKGCADGAEDVGVGREWCPCTLKERAKPA